MTPNNWWPYSGMDARSVTQFLDGSDDLPPVVAAIQDQQKGTGHACACALEVTGDLTGTVLVTYGDVPLLRTETLQALAAEHGASGNAVTVLTAVVQDPTGYGRILRGDAGELVGIVEQKDADPGQREITEINSGVYAFDGAVLTDALGRLSDANAAGERYLTDVVGIAKSDGRRVGSVTAADAIETEGINDRVQLADLARVLNARLVRKAQLAGVTVHDPATTWIHADVTIGSDTEILPGTQLQAGNHCRQRVLHRPGHHADRVHRARRGERRPIALPRSHHRTGRNGRPVQLPAPGHRADDRQQGRRLRRSQEVDDRPRLEGAAPHLRRGHHDRRPASTSEPGRSPPITTATTSTRRPSGTMSSWAATRRWWRR